MNGDQVRDTLFCRQGPSHMLEVAGYHPRQVNDLRRRVAAELDAGGSARPLIENATFRRRRHGLRYDIEAVDWFLDQFLLLPGHGELGGIGEDPWGDLPVARIAQRTSEKYAFESQCDSAWSDFGQLPGTHLWFGKAARGLTELRTAEEQTLASVRGDPNKTFSTGGRSFTLQLTSAAKSFSPVITELMARAARDHYGHYANNTRIRTILTDEWLDLWRRSQSVRELVDETGTPIFYAMGRNYNWRAYACIMFADQRRLRFLVRASAPANAIMTAVDQAGNRVARYRFTDKPGRKWPWDLEIIVHPRQKLTDELALVLATSAGWLEEYFKGPQAAG